MSEELFEVVQCSSCGHAGSDVSIGSDPDGAEVWLCDDCWTEHVFGG